MSAIPDLPVYLPFAEVARVAGFDGTIQSRRRYWRHLGRVGATAKVGRDRLVITDVLSRQEPRVFRAVYLARVANVGNCHS